MIISMRKHGKQHPSMFLAAVGALDVVKNVRDGGPALEIVAFGNKAKHDLNDVAEIQVFTDQGEPLGTLDISRP